MSRSFNISMAVVCLLIAVLIGWGVWYYFYAPQSPAPQPATPPSVATQGNIPTNLKKVRREYGPWKRTAPGQTGIPHLVMLLQSGAVDESNKTVSIGSGWKQSKPFQIVNFTKTDGHVRVRTTADRIYEVDFNQAFILEQSPNDVYAFRHEGSSGTVLVTTRTNRLSR
jgi:hypothetical protein